MPFGYYEKDARYKKVTASEVLERVYRFGNGGRPVSMYRLALWTGLSQPTIKNILVQKHTPRLGTKRKIMAALNPYAKAM